MSKVLIGVGIVVFWIAFGFAMMYININNNQDISNYITQSKSMQQPTIINILSGWYNGILFFFKSMFLIMPNIPHSLSVIVVVLQAMSIVFILLLLRG